MMKFRNLAGFALGLNLGYSLSLDQFIDTYGITSTYTCYVTCYNISDTIPYHYIPKHLKDPEFCVDNHRITTDKSSKRYYLPKGSIKKFEDSSIKTTEPFENYCIFKTQIDKNSTAHDDIISGYISSLVDTFIGDFSSFLTGISTVTASMSVTGLENSIPVGQELT